MAVAIIGRPNVGKSSLFNRLIGRKRALVWNQAGVTRDLIRHEWKNGEGQKIEVWDLAGFGGDGRDIAKLRAKEIEEIDLFIQVIDGSEPLTADDRECYQRARKLNKPIVIVLNKSDKTTYAEYSNEIYEFSPQYVFEISAEQKRGIGDLEDFVFETLKDKLSPELDEVEEIAEETDKKNKPDKKVRRIFILGRPNVGKSSLLNQLMGEDIAVVENKPGTTRDRILGEIKHSGLTWEFFDTAGIRKKANIYGRKADPLEIFSVETALHRMDEADYIVFVIEAQKSGQLTTQDRKLLSLIREKSLPTLIVVNKWDLYRKEWSEKDYRNLMKDHLGDLAYLPTLFISAKTGFQVKKIFQILKDLDKSFTAIPTSKLNKWLQTVLQTKPPRVARKGVTSDHFRTRTQYLKFYYMVQTSRRPMMFQVFCNAPQAVAEEDRRFFINNLRSEFKLQGIPFRFTFRAK